MFLNIQMHLHGKNIGKRKMPEINQINPNIYKQPNYPSVQNAQNNQNAQNHGAYGDNPASIPINYNDPRLAPIKEKANDNFFVQMAKGFIGEPIHILIGVIPFLALNKLLLWLPKGESFEKSALGKMLNNVDKLSGKMPKFEGIKKFYNDLKPTNIIKQIFESAPATPRFSMARNQITSTRGHILADMLREGMEINTTADKTKIEALIKNLEIAHPKNMGGNKPYNALCDSAFTEAGKLVDGKTATKAFKLLENRANFYTKAPSIASKFLMAVHHNLLTFLSYDFAKLAKPGIMNKGGALFHFLFIVPIGANLLGKIIKNTWDAPKKEKVSTAAHGVIGELGSWIMMLPLGFLMFKGIGGLKNLEGGGRLNRMVKFLPRQLGKFLSVGLDPTKKAASNWGKPWEWFKRGGGGTMRFALFIFGLQATADSALRGVSHKIFGTPHTLIAKEKAEEEAKSGEEKKPAYDPQKGLITIANRQKNKFQGVNNPANIQNNTAPQNTSANKTNPMMDKYLAEHAAKNQQATTQAPAAAPINSTSQTEPSEVNPQEIAAKNLKNKTSKKEQYMPSDSRKTPQEDLEKKAKFNQALLKTDEAIDEAEKILEPHQKK